VPSPRRLLPTLLAAAALTTSGCGLGGGDDAPRPSSPPAVEVGTARHFELRRVATGLVRPTWVGAAPGDPGALWVLEQPGRVLRLTGGGRRDVVLDLRREVRQGAEQGALGLAFHPDFARNGRFVVHWTARDGATRVAEFRRSAGGIEGAAGGRAPAAMEGAAAGGGARAGVRQPAATAHRRLLLALPQPEENHNGGGVAFGPDGRLYLGLGDGGGAFDPRDAAQDPKVLYGKLVATPIDGPPRWRPVLSGLRNPWRFWFDPALNEVWIGDVGQDQVEEVDRVPLELDEPPKNLGWPAFEGDEPLDPGRLRGDGELVWPVAQYRHPTGCSITGGLIYRGTRLPGLSGRYLYGDFCSGALWTLRPRPGGGAEDVRRERAKAPLLTHVGTDANGELVLATAAGDLLRAVPPRPA
jgi:glucose/arabinose dehydrogenase